MNNIESKEMSSFPLLFGKAGLKYQIDRVMGKDATSKHLMEIGFVNGAVLELVSSEKKGIIVKLLGSKIALDYNIAQKIYVHEYKLEDIETLWKQCFFIFIFISTFFVGARTI